MLGAVGVESAQGVAAGAVLEADDRRAESLDLADALDVHLGSDPTMYDCLNSSSETSRSASRTSPRLVPVVGEELVGLGGLPHARALERGVVVLRPGEAGLEDDLAGLPAGVLAGAAVGLDRSRAPSRDRRASRARRPARGHARPRAGRRRTRRSAAGARRACAGRRPWCGRSGPRGRAARRRAAASMISSASSMRSTCSPTGGQSIPHGDSFSDSPEPIPRYAAAREQLLDRGARTGRRRRGCSGRRAR